MLNTDITTLNELKFPYMCVYMYVYKCVIYIYEMNINLFRPVSLVILLSSGQEAP